MLSLLVHLFFYWYQKSENLETKGLSGGLGDGKQLAAGRGGNGNQAMETAGADNFLEDHCYSKCGSRITWELGRQIARPCATPTKPDSLGMEPSSPN